MIYHITYDKDGHKVARPVKNREELMALRGSEENLRHLDGVRQGNGQEKLKLVQLAYNLGHVDGKLAGCRSIGSQFFHDVDCYDKEQSERIKALVLEKKEEIGLLMLERSASGGWHLVCRRVRGTTILENQVRVACILQLEMDTSTKDLQRVVFTTSGSAEDLVWLDDSIFAESMSAEECEAEYASLRLREARGEEQVPPGAKKANKHYCPWLDQDADEGANRDGVGLSSEKEGEVPCLVKPTERIRYIVRGVMKEKGLLESDFLDEGGRHTTVKILLGGVTQLLNLKEVNGMLQELMPEHWSDANIQQLVSDFYKNYTKPNQRLFKYQEGLFTESRRLEQGAETEGEQENDDENAEKDGFEVLPVRRLPQGVKESVEAVGAHMAMPMMMTVCPCIGALATGVTLDVHGQKRGLNQISYIVGDFASGKGSLDDVVEAWMGEMIGLAKMYQEQEMEWRRKMKAAKNKKEQPEEPHLPVRWLTLNNTVANLAERLANTEGKHAFSFTPEADTVAQKWKSSMCDFSVMLRQSYDGSRYDREARSADAVNVHIEHLLWNVVMCGTPDALYRVVPNYTDGFQSRVAVARMPDNTFTALEEKPHVLTERLRDRIVQVAHLLPLMQGEVVLPKLEARGREWLERIRMETMMNDDKVKARQRFRVCVTAQRMTCCLMLCKVCEILIQKHTLGGAETQLKQQPALWKEMLLKTQTPQMLGLYDVIADTLMENALYFFRERIENAFMSGEYGGGLQRQVRAKNDSIYDRLDVQFTLDQAVQHCVAVKGAGVTRNGVRQMLKNWKKQGLIVQTEFSQYRKVK